MSSNFPFNLDTLATNLSKITVKGGLAGKICYVLIFVSVALAMISWSVKLLIVAIISAVLLFILVLIVLWRLLNLAERNPQAALMEGGEYLAHEQITVGTKNNPQIPSIEANVVVSAPVTLSPEDKATLDKPEDTPGTLEQPKQAGPEAG